MATVSLVLLIAAVVSFLLATFGVTSGRISVLALGLFFWSASVLLTSF